VSWPDRIFITRKAGDVQRAACVWDAGHVAVIGAAQADPDVADIVLTTEQEGVGIAAGAGLADGRGAADAQVRRTPRSWRGNGFAACSDTDRNEQWRLKDDRCRRDRSTGRRRGPAGGLADTVVVTGLGSPSYDVFAADPQRSGVFSRWEPWLVLSRVGLGPEEVLMGFSSLASVAVRAPAHVTVVVRLTGATARPGCSAVIPFSGPFCASRGGVRHRRRYAYHRVRNGGAGRRAYPGPCGYLLRAGP